MRIQEYNQTDFGVVFDLKKANARNKAKLVTIGCEKKPTTQRAANQWNKSKTMRVWMTIDFARQCEGGENHDPLIAQ